MGTRRNGVSSNDEGPQSPLNGNTPQTSLDEGNSVIDEEGGAHSYTARKRPRNKSNLTMPASLLPIPAIPPLSSPAGRHYLLTISTFILSTIGFACALSSGLSCNFLSINYYYSNNDNLIGDGSKGSVAGELSSEVYEGYEGDGFETIEDFPSSLGIFCTAHESENSSTSSFPKRIIFL